MMFLEQFNNSKIPQNEIHSKHRLESQSTKATAILKDSTTL